TTARIVAASLYAGMATSVRRATNVIGRQQLAAAAPEFCTKRPIRQCRAALAGGLTGRNTRRSICERSERRSSSRRFSAPWRKSQFLRIALFRASACDSEGGSLYEGRGATWRVRL